MLFTYVAYIVYSSGNGLIFLLLSGRHQSLVSGVTIVRQFGNNKCIYSQSKTRVLNALTHRLHQHVFLKASMFSRLLINVCVHVHSFVHTHHHKCVTGLWDSGVVDVWLLSLSTRHISPNICLFWHRNSSFYNRT